MTKSQGNAPQPGADAAAPASKPVDATPLANRLAKNAKHWGKWARRQGISCYRLYDRDVPEFPLIVDWYEAEGGAHVHLQEVDTGWKQSDEAYAAWIDACVAAVAAALAVPPERVHLKRRERHSHRAAGDQYQASEEEGRDYVVSEGGQRFWVNFDRYLDTGLFLDHRNTRGLVRQLAAGKHFLNLFAYTGSFTVYAAAGGAIASETVDLSNTYQGWAAKNFVLNDLSRRAHQLIRSDVFEYLRQAETEGKKFDLIVCDPPTFSNSKKMRGVLDVQRDHPWLILQCMKLLSPGGELIFSNNLRTFSFDPGIAAKLSCEEISEWSVPEDFRNRKIHRCWRIRSR